MQTFKLMAAALSCMAATTVLAQEPPWNASAIKECDRACHVEAAPFVTLPYGLGNGWTPGSGR